MRDLSALLPWLAEAGSEPEADPITEAYARGQANAEADYRRRLAAIRIEASAQGRLIDPHDAVAYIDPAEFDPDDTVGISGAITALVDAKPHLAAPRREPKDGNEWARAGFAAVRRDPRLTRLT